MNKLDFLKYVRNNATVIDAGANKGFDTLELSNIFSNGTVYGIEPITHHFAELTDRTKDCANVKLLNVALHNRNGNSEMFVSSGNTTGSDTLLKPKEHLTIHPDVFFKTKQKVETITLDKFVKDNNITGDVVCWFDMEGSEYNVLSASRTAIKQIKLIYTEYSIKERYTGQILFKDYTKFLEKNGFTLIHDDSEYNYIGMGNALFVRQ